jgi:hypothetical protein
MTKQS